MAGSLRRHGPEHFRFSCWGTHEEDWELPYIRGEHGERSVQIFEHNVYRSRREEGRDTQIISMLRHSTQSSEADGTTGCCLDTPFVVNIVLHVLQLRLDSKWPWKSSPSMRWSGFTFPSARCFRDFQVVVVPTCWETQSMAWIKGDIKTVECKMFRCDKCVLEFALKAKLPIPSSPAIIVRQTT